MDFSMDSFVFPESEVNQIFDGTFTSDHALMVTGDEVFNGLRKSIYIKHYSLVLFIYVSTAMYCIAEAVAVPLFQRAVALADLSQDSPRIAKGV